EFNLKEIKKLVDNLNEKQIELARYMSKRYFCNMSDCIKLMLTPGTRGKETKVQDKLINTIYLKKSIDEIEFDIENKKLKSEKQIKILKFISDNEGATIPEIEMFTDTSRAIINALIRKGYLEVITKKIERDPLKDKQINRTSKLELTNEQKTAYEKVENSINKEEYKQFLLYGITGSR
ncbi:MAG: hypothetical protein HUJ68_11660, partial [Clostridia bacterium]|nr:hypothetical protein [Clostridia bacterium]